MTGRTSRTEAQSHSTTEKTPAPASAVPEPESKERSSPPQTKARNRKKTSNGEDLASKVATLEIEMAKMEDAFSQELSNIANKLAAAMETATFWEKKHCVAQQQFLTVETDLRALQHENYLQAREREEKEMDVHTRLSSLLFDRDDFRERYQTAKEALWASERDVERLSGQIKALKDFVSNNSKTEGQATDKQVGEMMRSLGNGLQNWVIVNFRRAKMDVARLSEETKDRLAALVPTYETLASTAKLQLMQSVVSRLLVTEIFDDYYVGLPPERALELRNMEAYLFKATGDMVSPNHLRSTTLSAIHKAQSMEVTEASSHIVGRIGKCVEDIACETMELELSETSKASLNSILESAVDLARLLRIQKALFTAVMPVLEPHHVNKFDAEMMEDVGGEDDIALEGQEIKCIVFPGLVKQGDISGQHTSDLRNVIAKARVLCSPD